MAVYQMAGDPNDMMSMLDNSMYGGYDAMTALDVDDSAMSQSHAMASTSSLAPTPASQGPDGPYGPDDYSGGASGVGGLPPLPNAVGGQNNSSSSNTLTEFTKRRNWAPKVVEELQDILQILDANGKIRHVSPSIASLTGHKAEEVLDKFLRDFIHPDDVGVFVADLNESIASGNPLRLFYRFRKSDNTYAIFESVGHAHIASAKFAPNPNNQTPFCQAVFMMSRPYPTKNAQLLDSFLEHKIENERLKRRIAELRREEEEAEAEDSRSMWRQSQEGQSELGQSDDVTTATGATPFHRNSPPDGSVSGSMGPPERPTLMSRNMELTRENLEGIVGSRPDSIREKMARYEGTSHADTIEMLTGLRYMEGERSRGITTGNTSPSLIKGDAGIAMPVDRDPRTGEKKKKQKVAEEYVCTDCGMCHCPPPRVDVTCAALTR